MRKIVKDEEYTTKNKVWKVRIVATDARGDQPIVALISNTSRADDGETVVQYNADGTYARGADLYLEGFSLDLSEPEKRLETVFWLNIYTEASAAVHRTEDRAAFGAKKLIFARIPVHVNVAENQGLTEAEIQRKILEK